MSKETLLLSASRQPYRRGGIAIGPKRAPTRVVQEEVADPAAFLAILRDTAIAVSLEVEEGSATVTRKIGPEERQQAIAGLEAAIAASSSELGNAGLERVVDQLLDGSADTASEVDGEASSQDASGGVGEAGGDTSPPVDPATASVPSATSADEAAVSSAEGSTDTASASQDASVVTSTEGPSAAPAADKPARKAKPKSTPSKD